MKALKLLFLSILSLIFISCNDNNTNTPDDTNNTDFVIIGNQTWTKRNLNVDHYRNGDPIRYAKTEEEWLDAAKKLEGAWCYYDYNTQNGKTYGKLYNFFAVNDPRGLAPEGWHIPQQYEWLELIEFLGSEETAGGKMKDIGTSKWKSPNIGATNISGFSGLPGGFCANNGTFGYLQSRGFWWSSTDFYSYSDVAWYAGLFYDLKNIYLQREEKNWGFSVRCVKDSIFSKPFINSIYPNSVLIGQIITLFGMGFGATQDKSYVSFNGINATEYISWSDKEIKVIIPPKTTTGYITITANRIKSNELEYFITNSTEPRESITIDNQIWMSKNLDIDHYRNGDPIPQVTDPTQWANLTTGAWCYFKNDAKNGVIYGKLYNWYAVIDPRGLAPDGWHIPSVKEWYALINYLDDYPGGKLKESSTNYWLSPNVNATNESGFTAIPGGFRRANGTFSGLGSHCSFWTPNEENDKLALSVVLFFDDAHYNEWKDYKNDGFSVRCIKD